MRVKRVAKRLVFSLIPLVVLCLIVELFFRFSGLAKSPISSQMLPGERAEIYRFDPHLFWTLKPNQVRMFQQVTVITNSHGLRSEEIGDRQPNEYRILSLGESTTFGAGVENRETYSALLQQYLNRAYKTDRFKVINAGVSAYTSFQSLMYLKTEGLKLKPDMVVFYHETNDYLPSYLRGSGNTVIGMNLSDKQRYESQVRRVHRTLMIDSATYRYINYRMAYAKMEKFQQDNQEVPPHYVLVDGEIKPMKFPTRVSPEERLENFQQLKSLCEEHQIQLVVIHPSYRDTTRHECILTRFCQKNDVAMLEIQDAMHPPGGDPENVRGRGAD